MYGLPTAAHVVKMVRTEHVSELPLPWQMTAEGESKLLEVVEGEWKTPARAERMLGVKMRVR